MLQNIHDKTKGWVSYVIVGLIAVPFALFGINQYFEGGGKMVAAEVNGEEIPVQVVQNTLQKIKQQFGGTQLPPEMDASLKQTALDSVVNQTLLQQKIKDSGYRASNQEVADTIAAIDAFHKDGKFDKATYEDVLKRQRRDAAEFESVVRDDLSQQQLRKAIMDTSFLPKSYIEQNQLLQNQQREIETFTLKVADYKAKTQVDDKQVQEFYDKNKAQFMTDERVQVAYIELNASQLAEKVTVDAAALKQWFDENASHYQKPEERMVSRILVAVQEPAQDAQAKQKIDALHAEIAAGKRTFEAVAKADSDDKASAEKDGAMGAVVAADWGPLFNKAVQALKVDQVSAPVKTEAGYEIFKLTAIKPPVQLTFDEVKSQAEADYRKQKSEEAFAAKAKELENLAYENEGDLAPVAKGLGLTVQQSEWMTREQGTGIALEPKVRTAAFTEQVLKEGKNSDPVEVGENQIVVMRKVNHEAPTQKPLDAVKEEIKTTLTDEQAAKLVNQKAEETFKKLTTVQAWSALAETGAGVETAVEKVGFVGRSDTKIQLQVIQAAFALSQPAAGKVGWTKAELGNGDVTLIALKSVKNGEKAAAETADIERYQQGIGATELNAVLEGMREQAQITLHPDNI